MSWVPVMSRRVPADRLLDHRKRRQQAAREDVRLDPVRARPLGLVVDVRERDRLEAHPPARLQRPVDGAGNRSGRTRAPTASSISIETIASYWPSIVAVVAQLDAGQVARGRRRGSARVASACWAGEIVIEVTRSAKLPSGVQREAAPARADLEDVHSRSDPGPLGDDTVLVALGIGQGLLRAGEQRARVGHRLVEEEAVEVIAQVVMTLDVAARPEDACCGGGDGRWSAAAGAAGATIPGSGRAPRD